MAPPGTRPDARDLAHLSAWAERALRDDERERLVEAMVAFATRHPEVLDRGDGWPDIRRLVELRMEESK